eukprot:COSAG05_NODE_64_length_22535_cov_29.681940_7_plen_217_part_00
MGRGGGSDDEAEGGNRNDTRFDWVYGRIQNMLRCKDDAITKLKEDEDSRCVLPNRSAAVPVPSRRGRDYPSHGPKRRTATPASNRPCTRAGPHALWAAARSSWTSWRTRIASGCWCSLTRSWVLWSAKRHRTRTKRAPRYSSSHPRACRRPRSALILSITALNIVPFRLCLQALFFVKTAKITMTQENLSSDVRGPILLCGSHPSATTGSTHSSEG